MPKAWPIFREMLHGFRENRGFTPYLQAGGQSTDQVLGCRKDGAIAPQGYVILVSAKKIELRAADLPGLRYALDWLQREMAKPTPTLRAQKVEDAPAFQNRGVMLDVSRTKVPTMTSLKSLIVKLADLRINQFQLYTEHTFAFRNHEQIWADASPYTASDMLELDAYCLALGVELVPNFNSFGHFERWLKHPTYRKYAECPSGFTFPWGRKVSSGTVLKPSRASLRLLRELHAELLPNFTSRQFNVGCDETWELGHGASKKLCETIGKDRVYLDFLLQIHHLCRQNQRKMQFWGDILIKSPHLIEELPDDLTALSWGYEADHPFDEHGAAYQRSRKPFYVCPGTSSWNSLCGRTHNMLENIRRAGEAGTQYGAVGMLVTDWGDNGHHQVAPVSYAGYVAGALAGWNPDLCTRPRIESEGARIFHGGNLEATKAFLRAGELQKKIHEPFVNSGPFHHLLFRPKLSAERTGRIRARELRACIPAINQLQPWGDAITDPLIKKEFDLMVSMIQWGVSRGSQERGADIPWKFPARKKQQVLRAHQAVWEARNRVGGHNESLGHLEQIPTIP